MKRRTFLTLPAVAGVMSWPSAKAALADDVLVKAMRDEMKRSLKKLQLENLEKPYFLSYRLVETETVQANASFGALVSSSEGKRRVLATECRVGSPAMDNTNFYAMRTMMSGVVRVQADFGASMPLDDDYDEYRRQLWLFTDSAYKQALDDLAKKRAALEHRTRTGVAADFSVEDKVESSELVPAIGWKLPQVEKLAKDLSALFKTYAGIDNSGVRIESEYRTTRFVSSEGTEYWRAKPDLMITIYGEVQAADGMPTTDAESVYAHSPEGLPTAKDLEAKVKAMAERLLRIREATTVKRYAGPVLFEGAAAAELFAQGFASTLLGSPRIVVDDERFERMFGSDEGTLADKLDTRVLPTYLTLVNDPTRKGLGGSYEVDEEGVKAKATTLVENGLLKELLHTRSLIAGTTKSTASRRAAGVAPANLVVSSTRGLAAGELKAKLLELVRERKLEYGVIVRKIANPSDQFARPRGRVVIVTRGGGGPQGVPIAPVIEAVKVYPDGREEVVRNLEISSFGPSSFRELAAVSQEMVQYTAPFRAARMSPLMGGVITNARVLVSYVVPQLLFEDITLQQPTGEIPKKPFIGHPSFA